MNLREEHLTNQEYTLTTATDDRFKPHTEFISYEDCLLDDKPVSGNVVFKLSEPKAFMGERLCSYSYLNRLIDLLAGRSLTLIETMLTDKEQKRAAKDTLKALIADQREKVYREVYLGE